MSILSNNITLTDSMFKFTQILDNHFVPLDYDLILELQRTEETTNDTRFLSQHRINLACRLLDGKDESLQFPRLKIFDDLARSSKRLTHYLARLLEIYEIDPLEFNASYTRQLNENQNLFNLTPIQYVKSIFVEFVTQRQDARQLDGQRPDAQHFTYGPDYRLSECFLRLTSLRYFSVTDVFPIQIALLQELGYNGEKLVRFMTLGSTYQLQISLSDFDINLKEVILSTLIRFADEPQKAQQLFGVILETLQQPELQNTHNASARDNLFAELLSFANESAKKKRSV